jgi:uncharacterized protein YndB with AHSA1/START domain
MPAETRVTRLVRAPRADVYRELLDPDAIAKWRVPEGMTCLVHAFDARVGGRFRVSLTYASPERAGKSSEHTDTYGGRFVELEPDRRIVEELAFETDEPAMRGEMRITTTLTDAEDGTMIEGVHEGLPGGVRPEDNVQGWNEAFARLADLLEGRET